MERYNKVKLSNDQLEYIKENNGKKTYNQIAKHLGVSCYLIRVAMIENNIPYIRRTAKPFYDIQRRLSITEEQKNYLLENRGKISMTQIAKDLNLTIGKLSHNARILNLTNKTNRLAPVIEMDGYFNVDAFGKYYHF